VAELIRERLLEKPVAFRFDYPAELPRYFKGDPTRLRQVFINLLGNAVKFTASGEVALVVSEEGTPPGGEAPVRRLSLTVRDTGIGIPPERQADVFKAFVQGDGSTTRKFGGTGLGLTITRELVERMGGTIDLDSAAGQGSSFTVRLPLPEGQPAWGKAFCLPSLKELNGLGALLIEGNPEDRMLLTRYLLDLGLRVAYLASGTAEALAWFNQHAPEIALVLCDTQLYDEGGATFAQTLGRRPDRKKFKLLAINQDAQPGNSRLAQAEGFDGYLAKPVRQAEFVRVVVGVLGDQRPDRDQIINRHLMQEFVQRNVSVLVAEDNDINRLLVKTLLEKMGCRVETAQNGREAVTALGARPFDLLLMDVQMPELDGLKATREIREKLGLDIPIIALTADTLDEDAAECRRAGMNDYLSKPIDVKQLQEKILAWTQNPSNRQPSA
jgi:CheY-like chemotaxis protein